MVPLSCDHAFSLLILKLLKLSSGLVGLYFFILFFFLTFISQNKAHLMFFLQQKKEVVSQIITLYKKNGIV